jgi:hypothetical protein
VSGETWETPLGGGRLWLGSARALPNGFIREAKVKNLKAAPLRPISKQPLRLSRARGSWAICITTMTMCLLSGRKGIASFSNKNQGREQGHVAFE